MGAKGWTTVKFVAVQAAILGIGLGLAIGLTLLHAPVASVIAVAAGASITEGAVAYGFMKHREREGLR